MNKWFLTGDFHGREITIKERLMKYTEPEDNVIILGDAGLNYYGNYKDKSLKYMVNSYGRNIYCVRGNHEMRPEDVEGMISVYDEKVCNNVYVEEQFPHIKYLKDGATYIIDGKKCLVLGGAYSIDKEYRQLMGWGWFENEQLSADEMKGIAEQYKGETFDCILSHTCPTSFQPRAMFLPYIDQSKVDNSMEVWMEEFKDSIEWNEWLFGHYHGNVVMKSHPLVFMLFDIVVPFQEPNGPGEKYGK